MAALIPQLIVLQRCCCSFYFRWEAVAALRRYVSSKERPITSGAISQENTFLALCRFEMWLLFVKHIVNIQTIQRLLQSSPFWYFCVRKKNYECGCSVQCFENWKYYYGCFIIILNLWTKLRIQLASNNVLVSGKSIGLNFSCKTSS